MNIKLFSQLSKELISTIEKLIMYSDCGDYEPFYEEDSYSNINCFALMYEKNNLIGFVSALIYENEAEITGVVHPDFRHQCVFTKLLNALKEELSNYDITDIYGTFPHCTDISKEVSHHEYLMCVEKNNFTIDIASLHNKIQTLGLHIYKCDYNNPSVTIPEKFILKNVNRIISLCNLAEENSFTNLWGVLTKEPYRNKGYGSILINYVVNDYFTYTDKPLVLNVTSTNTAACKLYTACGFKIMEDIVYYKL